jgi:hypothetical protein
MNRSLLFLAAGLGFVSTVRADEASAVIGDIQSLVRSNAPAKAFDPILRRLSDLMIANTPEAALAQGVRSYGANFKNPRLGAELLAAKSFAVTWQQYVFDRDVGDSKGATNDVLLVLEWQTRSDVVIIPRSEILALRLQPPPKPVDPGLADAIGERVGQVIKEAKKPSDLDEILGELATSLGQQSYDSQYRNRELMSAVTEYQDFLQANSNGDTKRAAESLNLILSHQTIFQYIPRSELLRLMPKS